MRRSSVLCIILKSVIYDKKETEETNFTCFRQRVSAKCKRNCKWNTMLLPSASQWAPAFHCCLPLSLLSVKVETSLYRHFGKHTPRIHSPVRISLCTVLFPYSDRQNLVNCFVVSVLPCALYLQMWFGRPAERNRMYWMWWDGRRDVGTGALCTLPCHEWGGVTVWYTLIYVILLYTLYPYNDCVNM